MVTAAWLGGLLALSIPARGRLGPAVADRAGRLG